MDFYGTVAAGDVEVVHRVCQRLVHDFRLPMSAHDLAVAWGNNFFATADASNHQAFRSLHQCECHSLLETLKPLRGEIDPEPYVADLTAYWQAPHLQPEAIDVLSRLELPVCCVSNADTRDIQSAIEMHGLAFAEVITSEDTQCYKPSPVIFNTALAAMGVAPGDVLHVGDSLHSDIGGAKSVGIEGVWICRDRRIHDIGRHQPDHRISDLTQLFDLVGQ